MSRAPARFTEADVRRAVKVVERATKPMAVEIKPDGTIRIVPMDETERWDRPRVEEDIRL